MYFVRLPKIRCACPGPLPDCPATWCLCSCHLFLLFWKLTCKFSDNVIFHFLWSPPTLYEGAWLITPYIQCILHLYMPDSMWGTEDSKMNRTLSFSPLSLTLYPLPTPVSGSQCSGRQSSKNSTWLVLCIRWWNCRDRRWLCRILIISSVIAFASYSSLCNCLLY